VTVRLVGLLRWYLVGAGLGVLALTGGVAWAAFSATSVNSGSSFSAASSFCASPGSQSTVNADADAWVQEDNVNTQKGTANPLEVKSDAGKKREPYLHFALPAAPHDCSVSAATLRLFTNSLVSGRTIEVFRAAGTWVETTITWANQPGTTGTSTSAASATGWVTWSVTSQVQALYSGTNTGLVVIDQGAGNATNRYNSREASSNDPELTVTWG
jgi:hypothetical protein